MNGVVATMVIMAFSAMLLFALRDDGMEQCQAKGYSYDTCFHSLNR